nr:CoA ester lyase [Rhodoferax sp.]
MRSKNTSPVLYARSLLFVPATRPERFAKAFDSGTDCIVIDLEDAVAEESKSSARDQLAQQLPKLSPEQLARTLVRVNAVGTPWHDGDVEFMREWTDHGVAVMLPKSEDAGAVRGVAERIGPLAHVVALIESLAGLDALDVIARAPKVVRLAFGHLDFQLDMGMRCSPEEPELAFVRNAIVAASRRSHLSAPIDGVTADTSSAERLALDSQRARAFGFGGKLCIHPSQVAGVHRALGYTEADLDWARRVIAMAEQYGGNAFAIDGRMVDLPVIRAAEAMLMRS